MVVPTMGALPATPNAARASWREILSRFPQRSASRPTLVYLVCSARPRVGKTLLARLIVEYCRRDAQPTNAYMINPIDVTLNDFLPRTASNISLSETRGQMALFDRLVIDDATTKIIDLGHQALDQFFTIAYDIEFAAEARRHGIDVLVAYVADPSEQSLRTYAALRERFPEFSFVPTFNDAICRGLDFRNMFPAGSGPQPLMVAKMTAAMQAVADSHPFSFIDFLRQPPANLPRRLLDEIDGFLKRVHRQLREIELSLLLNRLRLTLNESAERSSYL
jgi:hypothetical protein